MSELESAALTLAGATLAFVLLALAIWWWRRARGTARTAFAAPKLPRVGRKAKSSEAPVAIAPERLARIGRQPPPPVPTQADPATEPDAAPIEDMLEAMASDVERQAHGTADGNAR